MYRHASYTQGKVDQQGDRTSGPSPSPDPDPNSHPHTSFSPSHRLLACILTYLPQTTSRLTARRSTSTSGRSQGRLAKAGARARAGSARVARVLDRDRVGGTAHCVQGQGGMHPSLAAACWVLVLAAAGTRTSYLYPSHVPLPHTMNQPVGSRRPDPVGSREASTSGAHATTGGS